MSLIPECRGYFLQGIYSGLGLILLGRWRLWIIGTWHPPILSTMWVSLCELKSSQQWWGLILWHQALLGSPLLSPPMPVGSQCPSDRMWVLRLWKCGSPVSLPFVVPSFGIWSVLHPVFSVSLSSPHPGPSLLSSPSLHSSWKIPSPPPPHGLASSRSTERAGEFPCH